MVKKDKQVESQSLYYELKKFYEVNKGELYSFQNFSEDGKKEFEVLTGKIPPLKEYEKNRLSYDAIKIVLGIIKKEENYNLEMLEGYLTLNPVLNYIDSVIDTFSSVVENDAHIKEKISSIIENILLNSKNENMVKFALTISPILKIDNLEKIFDVFSIQNKYLFYVIKGYKEKKEFNFKIFEKAKISKGYGRVFCVEALKPSTFEIQKYLINEACNNEVGVLELVEYTLLSIDLYDYLENLKNSKNVKDDIELFAKSFGIMVSDYGVNEIKNEINVCNKIVEIVDQNGGGIYSLYMIISILYSLEATLIEYYKEHDENNIVRYYDKYQEIVQRCLKVCKKSEWNEVVSENLTNIDIETVVIVTCMEKIEYKIKKKDFDNLIKRDFENPIIYKYALNSKNTRIRKAAIEYGLDNLKLEKILSGASKLKINNVSYEQIEEVCFFIIIKYSKESDFYEGEYKELNLESLNCALEETRKQAIENLKNVKNPLNDDDKKFIEDAIGSEVSVTIKKALEDLLGKKDYKIKKSMPIYKIDEVSVHARDIYLTSAALLNDDLDISSIYNKIEINQIIYLILEANNEDVCVCTANGYVMGYLPQMINTIIKNLLRNNKYVYGRIEDFNEDYSKIKISIFLSYKDVIDEIDQTLTLLYLNKNEYIQ